jgi:hypothetical protein
MNLKMEAAHYFETTVPSLQRFEPQEFNTDLHRFDNFKWRVLNDFSRWPVMAFCSYCCEPSLFVMVEFV